MSAGSATAATHSTTVCIVCFTIQLWLNRSLSLLLVYSLRLIIAHDDQISECCLDSVALTNKAVFIHTHPTFNPIHIHIKTPNVLNELSKHVLDEVRIGANFTLPGLGAAMIVVAVAHFSLVNSLISRLRHTTLQIF